MVDVMQWFILREAFPKHNRGVLFLNEIDAAAISQILAVFQRRCISCSIELPKGRRNEDALVLDSVSAY